LGYTDTEDRITFGEILKKLQPPVDSTGGLENPLNTIYITEAGLYQLIFGSKKEEAIEFKKFVTHDLLPNLRKNGSYSINDDYIKDTSKFISFFDTHNTIGYDNTPTIYIGVVGIHNNIPLFKFGKTNNILDRLAQHKKEYGEQFIMLSVYKTLDETNIENSIREYVKTHNLQCKISNCTELFTSNNISQVQLFVYNLISQNGVANDSNDIEKLRLQVRLAEINLEALKINKGITIGTITEPLKETTVETIELTFECLYERFIHECIKKTDNESDKLFHSVMYSAFEKWFILCFPDKEVPSDKAFSKNITKYIYIEASIRIGLKVQRGCRGYQLLSFHK
jgi:hypothetical protein